jgi:hypothetical protein
VDVRSSPARLAIIMCLTLNSACVYIETSNRRHASTLEEEMHWRFAIRLLCRQLIAVIEIGSGSRTAEGIVICEVRMQFMRCNTVKSGAEVISGILNCVCPECGGRMGERGKVFRCQGECLTDWRQAWERVSAELGPRSKRAIRRI